MRKNYVLDTNILIYDPKSIFNFEDNNLYIPIYVLEELDKFKSEQTLRGRNSREACRIIDDLRLSGSLAAGVDINESGKFIVWVPSKKTIPEFTKDVNSMDNAILQSALDIKSQNPELQTILVTMDVNLRIRADSMGLGTDSYKAPAIDIDSMRKGFQEIEATDADINDLYSKGLEVQSQELIDNTCIMLKSPSKTALCRFVKTQEKLVPLQAPREGIMGIRPRNKEQQFALDLLLDDNVKLVTLVGSAGSGKTLLATAVGLSKVLSGKYSRFLISRPIIPMGKDIGFLPGSLEEKLDPWMQPIYDNIELLMMGGGKKGIRHEDLINQDLLRIEPITYIRGRSISNQFLLLDESQNVSNHELKTIISRCGEGTKIVITGDPDQIDNPYLDKTNCGLSVAVEKLQDNHLVGHLTLVKGERSELANLAVEKL